jgi:hypothetical protein
MPNDPVDVVRLRESIPEPVNTMPLAELVYWEHRREQDRWSVLQRRLSEIEAKLDALTAALQRHGVGLWQAPRP